MFNTELDEAKSITTSPERLTELVDMGIELARAVAANPNAPPKLLQKLSKLNDLEIRQNVTGNPNTAIKLLFKLSKDFPEEFLNNSVLTLLLLENPNFVETIPDDTFTKLLQVTDAPIFFERVLQAPASYQNRDWSLAIASNPNTTKEVLLKLCKQFSKTNIAQAALLHVNWNGEITAHWNEAAFIEIRTCGYISRDNAIEKLLQELGIIPQHLRPYSEEHRNFVSLYKHSFKTYKRIYSLNHVPILSQFISKIIDSLNNNSKTIDSSTTSRQFLLFLVYCLTKNILEYSIKYDNTTLLFLFLFGLLTIISPSFILDLSKLVLFFVVSIIFILLISTVSFILVLIAALLCIIFIRVIIKALIFINNKLKELIKYNKQERLEFKKNRTIKNNIYQQNLENASNINTDAEVLNKLAQNDSLKVQLLVAKHLNTPVEVLIKFAKSKSVEKKMVVAQNIKTPLSTLKYLALSPKKYQAVSLQAIKTIKQYYPEELMNILVKYVEKTPFPSAARLFLLLHKTAPSDFLARHYRSLDWRERYAVAQNPNTPFNILEKLKLDANCIVRATAKARF